MVHRQIVGDRQTFPRSADRACLQRPTYPANEGGRGPDVPIGHGRQPPPTGVSGHPRHRHRTHLTVSLPLPDPTSCAITYSVTNPFVQSMASNFDQALRLMEAALADCPDDLWETDLWPDEAATGPTPYGGLHGSAPWFLAYHALSTLDYDLTGEFGPWEPPQPFTENTYAFPNRTFTKSELLGYVDYCRRRVSRVLDGLTDELAARPLPPGHRHHGTVYGVNVGSMPLHVVEHASQIRQFLTARGIKVQPMPGDRGYGGDSES